MNKQNVYLYSDESSQTSTRFDRIGYSLVDRRIPNLLIIVFKTIISYPSEYLRDLFRLKDNIKNLREVNKLQVPRPWWLLLATRFSDTLRSLSTLSAFKKAVHQLRF